MAAARRTPREATGGLNRAPELKVHGIATVTALEICPPLADGAGEVVTGRYITRKVAATTRITLEGGAVVEGTKIHPIWSVDREDWVPLGELTVGEQLLGRDGPVRIITSEVVHKPTRVYNLEVNGEHVYQIGDLELLVHNAGVNCNLIGEIGESLARDRLAAKGWTILASLSHGRNGVDIIAQKVLSSGRTITRFIEAKANGSATSAIQRLGADGYVRNVLGRLRDLPNLSSGAKNAANIIEGMIERGEKIQGIVMRFDWRSGTLIETVKRWLPGVR